MQLVIKCLECNKTTRKVNLGKVYYKINDPSNTAMFEDEVICPKCKKNVSDSKFELNESYFLMSLITAHIGIDTFGYIPDHLSGCIHVNNSQYERIEPSLKSKPKFNRAPR